MKRALVTGITGQDGAYLARHLLDRGYDVIGACRHTASGSFWWLAELDVLDRVRLEPLDLLESGSIERLLRRVRPDEVYNLAAQSFVAASFDQPLLTAEVNALGVTRLLEAMRLACPEARFYQASTSEMFGKVDEAPQTERTPFHPRSPYAIAKLYAHWATVNAREAWGLHASSGILFNHESPLRGLPFVSRKITSHLARLACGEPVVLALGNLDARRDWGFAEDYVDGMWRMVQADPGGTFVLATGASHTVREFVDAAARVLDLPLAWEGTGLAEVARHTKTGAVIARVDPALYRPSEVDRLVGDASRARDALGWTPTVDFAGLAERMVQADLERARRGRVLQ